MTSRQPRLQLLRWRSAIRLAAAFAALSAAALALGAAPPGIASITGPACPPPAEATASEGSPSAKLLATLGVLRRAQTPADALPAIPGSPALPTLGEGVYVKFIRRARVVAETAYYVVPVEKGFGFRACGKQVFLVEATPGFRSSGGGASPAQIKKDGIFETYWGPRGHVASGVVPDGVAKVSLHYASHVRGRHGTTLSTTPVNNVFVTALPSDLGSSAQPEVPTAIVWRSAKGKIIRTIRPS
jgi:hypothetical protein